MSLISNIMWGSVCIGFGVAVVVNTNVNSCLGGSGMFRARELPVVPVTDAIVVGSVVVAEVPGIVAGVIA